MPMTSELDSVLIILRSACAAGYYWALHRVRNRIEKHDHTWYYDRKEIIARYIELFGRDRLFSFVDPPKTVRVTVGFVMFLGSLLWLMASIR